MPRKQTSEHGSVGLTAPQSRLSVFGSKSDEYDYADGEKPAPEQTSEHDPAGQNRFRPRLPTPEQTSGEMESSVPKGKSNILSRIPLLKRVQKLRDKKKEEQKVHKAYVDKRKKSYKKRYFGSSDTNKVLTVKSRKPQERKVQGVHRSPDAHMEEHIPACVLHSIQKST